MDSMKKIAHDSTVIVFLCPGEETKEDFRSPKFIDSPIFVFGCFTGEEDIGSTNTNYIQLLVWCNNEMYSHCCICMDHLDGTIGYYLCGKTFRRFSSTITLGFHKECIEPIEKNPYYHPKHPLQVLIYDEYIRNKNKICYSCFCYKQYVHYCSICDFTICHDCVKTPPLLTIENTKRHEHTLFYIPKLVSMTCDVCALDERRFFIYICQKCDFAVHKECIYFPYIIKISRHDHRLSFTSSFLRGTWFCRVCRKIVDENYGAYSCVKDCCYVVHSRCALHEDIWDEKELEGEPEERTCEDIMPFKEISDDIIQHFIHKHHMRLNEDIEKVIEENKRCQACTLPIYEGDIYSCIKCDFFLHKVCAYLPLKKQHAMHPHTLVLREAMEYNYETHFLCLACYRTSNSLVYMCEKADCVFNIDVHCATMSEPMDHHCHPHQLFVPSKLRSKGLCSICQNYQLYYFDCGECDDFILCFRCASLPKMFKYKYDEHPLIFSYIQDVNSPYYCDICENEIDMKKGSYTCYICKVTLHIECLVGKDMYIILGKKLTDDISIGILPNDHLTRYLCDNCHRRCEYRIVYKTFYDAIYCSMRCLGWVP